MKKLALVLALLLAVPAIAGEVNVSWSPSEGADGYRVYFSTESGTYTTPSHDGAGTGPVPFTNLLDGCVRYYMVLTAYNAAGESVHSNEVTFHVRPVVLGRPDTTSSPGYWIVNGGNFAPDVIVEISTAADPTAFFAIPFEHDPAIPCERFRIPVASIPQAPPYAMLRISNPNTGDGDGTVAQSVLLVPAPPVGGIVN